MNEHILQDSCSLQNMDDRPEPFASIYELIADYTTVEALESLQLLCSFDSEVEDTCTECRDQAAWLAQELMQFLARYARRFPPIESRINYHGLGRVQ